MVSWSVLLERGRQRNRRHYGHRLPLLRLLTDVDRLRGERLEGGAEAGEQVALLVLFVILLHDSALPETWTTAGWGWVCITALRWRGKPFNVAVRCASPREPISASLCLLMAADWCLSRGVPPTWPCTLFAFFICTDVTFPVVWVREAALCYLFCLVYDTYTPQSQFMRV